MSASRRVVVTGLGIVSPVGSDLNTAWSNILAGNSGIGLITSYDVSAYSTKFAGLVQGFKAEDWMGPKEIRKTDRFIHYGVAAAKQALDDQLPGGVRAVGRRRHRSATPYRPGAPPSTPAAGEPSVHALSPAPARTQYHLNLRAKRGCPGAPSVLAARLPR